MHQRPRVSTAVPDGDRPTTPDPVVTIITPTYNHERYIRETLESAVAQTDPRWEQIVVDDGSSDRTAEIVEAFGDPRIRLIRLEHRGVMHLAESYNTALREARGEFIAILEGDDFWPPDKIERELPMFERSEIVLAWGMANCTFEDRSFEKQVPPDRTLARMRDRAPGDYVRALLDNNFIPAGTVMVRRSALEAVGGFQQPDGMPTTDYPTWLALCRVGRFAVSPRFLGVHRSHSDQVTQVMATELSTTVDWGVAWVTGLPPDERAALGVTDAELRALQNRRQAVVEYDQGRAALADGRVRTARVRFRRAIRRGTAVIRLKATFAIAASLVGLDLANVSHLASRVRGR